MEIANKLGNILKKNLDNVMVCSELFCFLEDFCDRHDFMNTIFVLSESVLEDRDLRIAQILKKFDCYNPILTYRVDNDFYFKVYIN